MVKLAPLLIVILWQVPPAEPILGWFPPDGMVTSVEAIGMPPHQLATVFQSVLDAPLQVPAVHPVATFTIPVAVDKK